MSYYKINKTGDKAEICVFGEIYEKNYGWGEDFALTAFYRDFKAISSAADITVLINSQGGDVFAALAVKELLKSSGAKIHIKVVGLCASAAVLLLAAADDTSIDPAGVVMIHNPTTHLRGYFEAVRLTKTAEMLYKVRDGIAEYIASVSGKDADTVKADMDSEKWFTAREAVDYGLIGSVYGKTDPAAAPALDIAGIYNFIPEKIRVQMNGAPELYFYKNSNERNEETMEIKSKEELAAAYPEYAQQIADDAVQGERERLAALDEIAIPGYEGIIDDARKTGKSAAETAVALAKAVKDENKKALDALEKGANESAAGSVTASGGNNGFEPKTDSEKLQDKANDIIAKWG